ncbi:MAG TPA: type I restriction enzyme HsdR N-terminal domain-containing protein [Balneolales bacterium]|nr:type I restriction enzyme HsdR N-terminal domain-containing protein [Balneolales bacterium]
MKSVALFQYPHIVFEKGQKKLWNPIQRKRLTNRPEERVRLQLIDYLTLLAGWSPHRITTEIPVSLAISDTPNRADILCYDDEFNPRLLIECKAESVRINEKTGQQIGRYNTKIGAPYLMVSNGRTDYFFEVLNGNTKICDQKPGYILPEKEPSESTKSFDYWSHRGFAGHDASPELRKWLHDFLPVFWNDSPTISHLGDPLYLQLAPLSNKLAIDQYYRIFDIQKGSRIAFTFLSTPHGGTRVVGILNQSGHNAGLIVINPELVWSGQSPNSFVYNHQGEQAFDLNAHLSNELFFAMADNQWINRLATLILKLLSK